MTLTNSQYDSIQRDYDAAQLKNRRILAMRQAEVFSRCPSYEAADAEVSSLSVEFGRRLLADYRKALSLLSQRKATLLIQAGFPEDYLEPLYDCSDCKDTGYTDGRRCHCFERKVISLLYMQSNLDGLLATENFSSLSYEYYEGDDLQNFYQKLSFLISESPFLWGSRHRKNFSFQLYCRRASRTGIFRYLFFLFRPFQPAFKIFF